ncbi:MAG: NAD-binding protein [bacterium]
MRTSKKNTFLVNWRRRVRSFRRKYLRLWWQAYQWPVIAGIALFALALGYIGFRNYFLALGESRWPLDIFYLALQLFVLQSGAILGPVGWELELARWLAPAVAAYTALKAVAVIFREQLQSLRVRFIKDHIVICGLGRKGLLLAQRFCELGRRVLVIEQNEGNDRIDRCREQGALVMIGNAVDQVLLRQARVHRAKHLISVCGDDGVNAEVAVLARELVKDRQGEVLTCIVHIVDPQLCHLLREQEIGTGRVDAFRLEFFNNFDSGARAWLNEYPAFDETGTVNGDRPHLLIVGVGRLGESLIVHAAKKWKALSSPANEKLRITIIDQLAKIKLESLCLRYPQLPKVCELVPQQINIESPDFQRADFLFDDHNKCNITSVYVCLDDDPFALSAALALHYRLREYKIPIVVRMTHDAGLATLLRGEEVAGGTFDRLHAFGLLDKTYKPELLLAGTHEILARAIHEDYVYKQRKEGQTPQTNPSMVPWEELPEQLKESNRRQADHIGIKLQAIGCGIAPLTDWDAELFEFTEEEIELMAEMEHERWMSERLQAGWRYAPGEKNIKKKTSPYLVPMQELPEEIKELDRNTVRELPLFLAQAGFQIYRLKKVF